MANLRWQAHAPLAVSVLALAAALGSGGSLAATRTAAPRSSLTCVVARGSAKDAVGLDGVIFTAGS